MPKIVNSFPNVSLDIIGRDWKDPETGVLFSSVLDKLIDSKIKKYINIIGVVPHYEIPSRLESAHVCVYPSHMEAQGIVVVEAMSMEKAVVFSQTGPGKEMIKHEKNGLLCDPYDPDDIANQIIKLLKDKDLAIEYGKKARQSVLELFDMDDITMKNIEFYKSVL